MKIFLTVIANIKEINYINCLVIKNEESELSLKEKEMPKESKIKK